METRSEINLDERELQTALALSALALSFAAVLEEIAPASEPLAILQSKVQVELSSCFVRDVLILSQRPTSSGS